MKALFCLVTTILIAVGSLSMYLVNRPNDLTEQVSFVLDKGAGVRQMSIKLQKAGVINSPLLFRIVVRILDVDKKLKAGEYMFPPKINMLKVANQLLKGDVYYRKITLPEGLTSAQMVDLIKKEANLSGEVTLPVAEGSMLPETYSFSKGDSRDSVILQAQKAMKKVLEIVWVDNQTQVLKNQDELLVLASIVEKETGIPEERRDVASVFVNRLNKGMMLQTDPTVIYAITLGQKELGRALLRKDLEIDSPYNTYRHYGLPPKPICNPGKEAIIAAANPNDTDYLFFVASGNGGHRFARDLSTHNDNVALYKKTIQNKNLIQ